MPETVTAQPQPGHPPQLPTARCTNAIQRVTTFSDFNAENDPHEEHDFGSLTLAGRKFFFN
jgi:uncharacterized protein DUF3768